MYSLSTPLVPGWRIGEYYDETFRDDYEYTGSEDLDEWNGERLCLWVLCHQFIPLDHGLFCRKSR